MKVTISHSKASSVLNPYDNKFYDTGKPLDLPFSTAVRLSRIANVAVDYDRVDYDPSLWKDRRFINLFGDIDNLSGFGGCSYALIKYTPDINTALVGKVNGVRDEAVVGAEVRELNQRGAMVWHDQPRESWLYTPFPKNIAILPFETTRIPRSWLGKLAHFDALFVPCAQNIQMFRDSGITLPIELIHWGVDSTKFYPLERKDDGIFTFGHMGALSYRKGTDLLIDAFREAFPTEKDVRLICKTSYNTYPFNVKDKRIEVHLGTWSHQEVMNDFYKKVDCFVFPTRGEGFGLTPLEAMATGIPAIVTGWSGPMEYMTPEVGWTIPYKMAPAVNFSKSVYKEDCGDWAEPSKSDLIELMRNAYKNQDEVKRKGAAAAAYVKEKWLWQDTIKLYEQALEKHL